MSQAILPLAAASFLAHPYAAYGQSRQPEPIELGSVRVEATAIEETGTGPVGGPIARRSASGTKTDTPLIETPQAISIVTREQIEMQAPATIGQALRYTAGVVPEWRGIASASNDAILVRGSAGYSVDFYWDGLHVPTFGTIGVPNPDPYLFERIEVLKGPASVLYGQGAANGLVNYISKRPTEQAFGEIGATIGNYDHYEGNLDLGGPLTSDGKLLYRLTAMGFTNGSQIRYTHQKRIAVAPAITWKPDEATSLTVLGSYQREPDLGYYDTFPLVGTAKPNPLGKAPRDFYAGEPDVNDSNRTYRAIGYLFEHQFGSRLTFRQNLRFIDTDYKAKYIGLQSLAANNRTVNRYGFDFRRSGNALSIDNQLEAKLTTGALEHTLLLGLGYQDEAVNATNFMGTATAIDLFAPVYGGTVRFAATPRSQTRQTLSQLGLYAQDQIKWGKLSLLVGGRYDHAESKTRNLLNGTAIEMSDGAVTGRAGLVYEVAEGLAPYVSYSEAFQPLSGTDAKGDPFNPARSHQYEIGLRYQPKGLDALFTLALFDLTENNLSTPDDSNIGFNVQLGEVRTRGIEAEAKATLAKRFTMFGAFTYLDGEIRRGRANETGKARPNTPHYTVSLSLDYRVPGILEGLNLGGGVRYVGSSPANTAVAPNDFKAPGFTLVDAALRYDLGGAIASLRGTSLSVNVQNLFDKDYVASCGGSTIASGYCWPGYRRTASATLAYRW